MDIRPPTPRRARILKSAFKVARTRCSQVQGFHALGAKIRRV